MNEDVIRSEAKEVRARMSSPRAAAIAGIVFSVLLIIVMTLIRVSIPQDPHDAGVWLASDSKNIELALNMLPFAGIAFLWFIGVVRDRLGEYEDRLFSTVFLGSGLIYLAMLFASAAVAGGILFLYGVMPTTLIDNGIYAFGRAITYEIMNIYTLKMSGVFMLSTSTLGLRTKIFPRWMALLGIVLALFLLLSFGLIYWAPLLFPLWVLLISVYILLANLHREKEAIAAG